MTRHILLHSIQGYHSTRESVLGVLESQWARPFMASQFFIPPPQPYLMTSPLWDLLCLRQKRINSKDLPVIMNQRLSSFTFCLSLRHSFSSPVRAQSIHKWAQMIHPTFTRQPPTSRIEICLNLFSFEKVLNIGTSKTLSEDAKPWPSRT